MSWMVMEPPIGGDGFNLLVRAARHERAHGWAYPLAFESDKRGAVKAVAGGYVEREADDMHMVRLTGKGKAYLARMMGAD